MEMYLWLDRYDSSVCQVGTMHAKAGMICWGQLHIDGVALIFGQAMVDALKELRSCDDSRLHVKVETNAL